MTRGKGQGVATRSADAAHDRSRKECHERGLIIGECARRLVIGRIHETIAHHNEIGALRELRTLRLGPDTILAVLRVRFRSAMLVAELETIAELLGNELRVANPAVKHVGFDLRPTKDAGDK